MNIKNILHLIKLKDKDKFIEEFNKNKISDEFIEKCKRAGKLFKKDKYN